MPTALADTGCPKKRMPSVERQPEFITGQIGQMPNSKECRRGTGDDLNAGEMKLNGREKLGASNGGANVTFRTIRQGC